MEWKQNIMSQKKKKRPASGARPTTQLHRSKITHFSLQTSQISVVNMASTVKIMLICRHSSLVAIKRKDNGTRMRHVLTR